MALSHNTRDEDSTLADLHFLARQGVAADEAAKRVGFPTAGAMEKWLRMRKKRSEHARNIMDRLVTNGLLRGVSREGRLLDSHELSVAYYNKGIHPNGTGRVYSLPREYGGRSRRPSSQLRFPGRDQVSAPPGD